jgi:hypothetical protein
VPASADATLAMKLGVTCGPERFRSLGFEIRRLTLNPKMLTPALTYINSRAKLPEP